MSKPTIPLTPGCYFHVYNRGINSCPIFHDDADHERFLYLYGKYVGPVADTLAWVLMRTHIHFLLRIKEDVVYRYSMKELKEMQAAQRANVARSDSPPANASRSPTRKPGADTTGFSHAPEEALSYAKWETVNVSNANNKTPNPSAHLGHLFNAYARYFNLKYNRHGSLFENQFKRKPVEEERYLRNVVVYIHKNPEHHSYYADFSQYPWSSFHSCLDDQPAIINREEVVEWFGGIANFIFAHKGQMNVQSLEEWLEE